MGIKFGLNWDLTSPEDAQAHCRDLAERAVTLTQTQTKTKDAAIHSLTRRYRFGSWLAKLHRGQKVTIHLHYYERLCRALEDAARNVERAAARDRAVVEAIRGKHAATQGDRLAGVGRDEMDGRQGPALVDAA